VGANSTYGANPIEPREPAGQAIIRATSTAVPEHIVTLEDVKTRMGRVFDLGPQRLEMMLSVVDNTRIRKRHLIFPLEYTITPRPLSQTSQEYQEHSVALGRDVACRVLQQAAIEPRDVDLLVTVSCTGFMIPSLDAHLINDLGFRPDVMRLPITELGCAAGAASLGLAASFVRAYPGATVLIVAIELPSLTFQRHDLSPAHLISSVLFGDGAAAAVVTGRPVNGVRIVDSASHTFPHSLDAMGFDLLDSGFHIVLSKNVPQMIREKIRELVESFLGRHALTLERLSFFLLHPGGQKLLMQVQEELGLNDQDTRASWNVLEEYGNLSSATVLFVLHEWLRSHRAVSGEQGLMAAFGPGFSAEMLLLEWN